MTSNASPRDSDKDAETIELLIKRFHEQAHGYATSKAEDDGGFLSVNHTYQAPDGSLFRVQKVVPLWPKALRSQVIFEALSDEATFVLPLSKWLEQGFKAVLNELDVHSFRDAVASQIKTSEDVHSIIIGARRQLGINDAAEHHVPLSLVPALIDMVSSRLEGHRQTIFNAAAECLRSID